MTTRRMIRVATLTVALLATVVGLCLTFAAYFRPGTLVDFANRMFLC